MSGVAESAFSADPEVHIRRGPLPDTLGTPVLAKPNWMLSEQDFLLRMPGIARIQVSRGCLITLDAECSEADAMPFLLGTAFGALLHQRGILVLHASAVSSNGHAIALCGPSGAGKSTLAAALCQTECNFIGDDVAAIQLNTGGKPVLWPDSRSHRLWADTIAHLGLSERQGQSVRNTIQKYHIEPECEAKAMPLSTIVVVRIAEQAGQTAAIEPCSIVDAAALLRAEVYRHFLAKCMGRDAALFKQISDMLSQVRVLRLTRPREPKRLPETLALLRQHIAEAH
ncbi:hypothetical protein [Methylomonas fluvii]|uniref:hypothetical protein n=1 Tax=Methylomonas fluvii TaxID=1854564 RepID=UPI0018A74FC3|nr:hypothetical protein [Methylomonas fluvii]